MAEKIILRKSSKYSFFVLLYFGLMAAFAVSCGSSKSIPSGSSSKKEPSKSTDKETPKKDSSKVVTTPKEPKAEKSGKATFSKKSKTDLVYNVIVTLPVAANNSNNFDDPELQRSAEFYTGLKTAFDSLKNGGLAIQIKVIEAPQNQAGVLAFESKSDLSTTDMLIAPAQTDVVKAMAEISKKYKVVCYSPWNTSNNLVKDNPYFVQLRPGLKTNCISIIEDIMKDHKVKDVVLLVKNPQTERAKLDYFQEAVLSHKSNKSKEKIREISIGNNVSDIKNIEWGGEEPKVVILPQTGPESYVKKVLETLAGWAQDKEVTVYGFPQWRDFKFLQSEVLEKLNVRISSTGYFDFDNQNTSNFALSYYSRYQYYPTEEAMYGFDTGLYLYNQIKQGRQLFPDKISNEYNTLNYMTFDIKVNKKDEGSKKNEEEDIDYYENKFVQILQFKDGKFRKE